MFRKSALASVCSLFLCWFASGCTQREESRSNVRISLRKLEFGTIASTGQLIDGKFSLNNVGSVDEQVLVRGSCACIVSSPSSFVLAADEKRVIGFTLSAYGRKGPFHGVLAIQCSQGIQEIPVFAVFEPLIRVFPSRILLHESKIGMLVGKAQVTAPAALWPDLELSVAESKSVIKIDEDGETRNFIVEFGQNLFPFPPVVVKKRGQSTPVLSIPILSSHSAGRALMQPVHPSSDR